MVHLERCLLQRVAICAAAAALLACKGNASEVPLSDLLPNPELVEHISIFNGGGNPMADIYAPVSPDIQADSALFRRLQAAISDTRAQQQKCYLSRAVWAIMFYDSSGQPIGGVGVTGRCAEVSGPKGGTYVLSGRLLGFLQRLKTQIR